MQFKDFQLNPIILKAILEEGYTIPTKVQQQTIPLVLENKDVIVSSQTGTGKTAAFALPILHQLAKKSSISKKRKKISALIISPTRELALQIEESFKTYGKHTKLISAVIYGGTTIDPQKEILKKGVDILIATPGRLLDLYKQECINLKSVKTLVLDEADLMLDMGFIDEVSKIERLCPAKKQLLLFSATMPLKVVELANTILKDAVQIDVTPTTSAAESVNQVLYYVSKTKKMELCLHILRNTIKGDILIFRRTKFGVEKLENMLKKNGYAVESIHGDKSQSGREEALNNFKNKQASILIATDIASRGIDIDKLDAVINFDIPNVPETYVHRIGRTGRAGNLGNSYSFCATDEKLYIKSIEKLIGETITVETTHPYPLDSNEKPEVYFKKANGPKKNRKSAASKKNKKRWY